MRDTYFLEPWTTNGQELEKKIPTILNTQGSPNTRLTGFRAKMTKWKKMKDHLVILHTNRQRHSSQVYTVVTYNDVDTLGSKFPY